jgi:hypothetical protein
MVLELLNELDARGPWQSVYQPSAASVFLRWALRVLVVAVVASGLWDLFHYFFH